MKYLMVRLDRIYTKSGDKGKTSLGNGQRVMKHAPSMIAIGDVDELNACLGGVNVICQDNDMKELLLKIQNDLFDVGADLCMPDTKNIAITQDYTKRIEHVIDHYNQQLSPLKSFVLPGGTVLAAQLHIARTVCRRAERSLTDMSTQDTVNPHLLCYINRLSDLLFVLARCANGGNDILWEPQKWKTT